MSCIIANKENALCSMFPPAKRLESKLATFVFRTYKGDLQSAALWLHLSLYLGLQVHRGPLDPC